MYNTFMIIIINRRWSATVTNTARNIEDVKEEERKAYLLSNLSLSWALLKMMMMMMMRRALSTRERKRKSRKKKRFESACCCSRLLHRPKRLTLVACRTALSSLPGTLSPFLCLYTLLSCFFYAVIFCYFTRVSGAPFFEYEECLRRKCKK